MGGKREGVCGGMGGMEGLEARCGEDKAGSTSFSRSQLGNSQGGGASSLAFSRWVEAIECQVK